CARRWFGYGLDSW
nr:immunoglobulin heavy chain junction region [Macaca mulatta]MOV47849.1 immunoglobulin heavy chain junction region [Macaca mulatta]MOV47886.1 immunoglobulin heavy chain junction region [Macaca mulatta]